jgi:ribose transport system permease protein
MLNRLKLPREAPTLALIVAMAGGLALSVPAFRESSNLSAVGQNAALIGVLACGEALIILGAGLDLSVGSVMALAACITGACVAAGWSWIAAVAGGLAAALAAGAANGGLITDRIPVPYISGLLRRIGLGLRSAPRPPILTTLATLLLFRYGVSLLTHNRSFDAFDVSAPGVYRLGQGSIAILAFVLVTTLLVVLTLRTRYGRWTIALGGSEPAARLSALPTAGVTQLGYALSALCAGVSGILTMAYSNHAQWDMGKGAELDAIAACVVGGVRITGGDGSVLGAALGAVLIALLQNALVLLGRPKEQYGLFTGAVILIAAVLEQVRLARLRRKGVRA